MKIKINKDENCPICTNDKVSKFVLKEKLKGKSNEDVFKGLCQLVAENYLKKISKKQLREHLEKHLGCKTWNKHLFPTNHKGSKKRIPYKDVKICNKFSMELKKTASDIQKLDLMVNQFSEVLDDIDDFIKKEKDKPRDQRNPFMILRLLAHKQESLKSLFNMIAEKVKILTKSPSGGIDVNELVLKFFLAFVVELYNTAMKEQNLPNESIVQIHTFVRDRIEGWRDFVLTNIEKEGKEVPQELLEAKV